MNKRFARIWSIKKKESFTFKWYVEISGDDEKIARVFLSLLRKKGWVKVSTDQKNRRVKIYRLEDPSKIYQKLGQEVRQNENTKNIC